MSPSWMGLGGVRWRVLPEGLEIEGEGIQRESAEPSLLRRVALSWRPQLTAACAISRVPTEILLTVLASEGELELMESGLAYPAFRTDPGYVSDQESPELVSLGPMHVTLSSYRRAMKTPEAPRTYAMKLAHNLLAGALVIREGYGLTGWDPILVSARYSTGGLTQSTQNRWCLQSRDGYLDRAARFFGDACQVVRETEFQTSLWPNPRLQVLEPDVRIPLPR